MTTSNERDDLPEDVRRVMNLAASADVPIPEQASNAVFSKVVTTTAAGVTLKGAAAGAVSHTVAASSGSAKLALLAIGVMAVAGAGTFVIIDRTEPREQVAPMVPRGPRPPHAIEPNRARRPESAEPERTSEPNVAPAPVVPTEAPRDAPHHVRAPGAPAPAEDEEAQEAATISAAQRALATHAPQQALDVLNRARSTFGAHSDWTEERESLRVVALARLGRVAEARTLQARLEAHFPTSPYLRAGRTALAQSQPTP